MDLTGQLVEQRPAVAAERLTQTGRGRERVGNLQELQRIQSPAAGCAIDPGRDVLGAADSGTWMARQKRASLRCFVEAAPDQDRIVGRDQRLS